MDPNLNDILNALITRMNQMDRWLQEFKNQTDANCKDLATGLDRLETNQRRIPKPLEENEPRDNNRLPWRRRAQPYNTKDTNAQYVKSVKVNDFSFDGHLNPQAHIDWQLAMELYFRWHKMSEPRKIWFATMKQSGQARQYWENLERMMRYRRNDPIET